MNLLEHPHLMDSWRQLFFNCEYLTLLKNEYQIVWKQSSQSRPMGSSSFFFKLIDGVFTPDSVLHTSACSRSANYQNSSFYRVGHTSINKMYLTGSRCLLFNHIKAVRMCILFVPTLFILTLVSCNKNDQVKYFAHFSKLRLELHFLRQYHFVCALICNTVELKDGDSYIHDQWFAYIQYILYLFIVLSE